MNKPIMNDKFFQFLGLTKKAGKLIEGYNKCEELVTRGKGYLVILSEECSENTKDKFRRYCERENIVIIEGISNEKLGLSLGRTEINVLCVNDKSMSEKLINLYNKE